MQHDMYTKIYTNMGGKSVFLGCPAVVNGNCALLYVKNDEMKAISLKDLSKYFAEPSRLPHVTIK